MVCCRGDAKAVTAVTTTTMMMTKSKTTRTPAVFVAA
jgi:hypothetical protein